MKYIRIIATYVIEALLHIFYVFPIQDNRIIFNSYMWGQYSCNPKYISEYLNKNYPKQFELIWAFVEPEHFRYLEKDGIQLVKARSIKFYYYRMTAKISICNATMGAEIPKRKGQLLINTWHGGGGGYKRIEYSGAISFRSRLEMNRTDIFCASSETSLKNTVRIAFGHDGPYFPGTPRNDMLVNGDRSDIRSEVYDYLGVDPEKKIMLYAPTYREGSDVRHHSDKTDYELDWNRLHDSLERRFGGEWIIAIRFHPRAKEGGIPELPFVINATHYPDMQELLASVDALITDYSSSVWDFSFTNKPCFLFCTDLQEYEDKRGLNKPIHEWGFPVAETNDELEKFIMEWDEQKHRESMDNQHKINGSFEDGTATERMCRLIYDYCYNGILNV